MNILQLDSLTQSLALGVIEQGLPEVIYWGPKLSSKLTSDGASLTRKPLPPSKLVEYTPVSVIPEYGRGFFGRPGLEGHRDRAGWATQFQLLNAEFTEDLLVLFGQDPVAQLELKVSIFSSAYSGLFRIRSSIQNIGQSSYELEWLTAGCWPLPNSCNEVLTAGRPMEPGVSGTTRGSTDRPVQVRKPLWTDIARIFPRAHRGRAGFRSRARGCLWLSPRLEWKLELGD